MRIARSTSPRRRKRLPSANCSSTVCGFSLATCRNDSIALSGCSFRRKLRPRKYDEGICRDSDSRLFRSTRAATQPMPKKTGRARSHQNSNSMGVRGRSGAGDRRLGCGRAATAGDGDAAATDLRSFPISRRWRTTVGSHASSPITTPATKATSTTKTSGACHDCSGKPCRVTTWLFFTANQTSTSTIAIRKIQASACIVVGS